MNLTQEKRETFVIIFSLLVVLMSGTTVFMWIEDWHLIDALYFTTATLTTVGFGDVVPVTLEGKIFGIVYMWIGVTVAVYSIAYIGGHLIKHRVEEDAKHGWHLWHRNRKQD